MSGEQDALEAEQEARESACVLSDELEEIYKKYGRDTGNVISNGIMQYLNSKIKYFKEVIK